MKKIILICLIGLIWLIGPKKALAASFSLSPASANPKVGDVFPVDIVLDTGTDGVVGATAILKYDTAKLAVSDDDAATAGIQIKQGTVFNQTPLTNTVDASTGTIHFDSGSLGSSYTGQGTLATVNFRAVSAGAATVSFVFNASSTVDTSLVAAASGSNVLTMVNDGTYTITAATGSTVVAPQPPRVVYLPATGVVENTLLMLGAGMILLTLGIYYGKR